MSYTGFSLLLWVNENSTMLQGLHSDGAKAAMVRELLNDAATLIGLRWGIDVLIQQVNGTYYGYTNNTRFNVSAPTIRAALGTLTTHVEFQKSGPNTTLEQAVNYRECKLKWQVQDQITEPTSSGWVGSEQDPTSQAARRKRF